MTVLKSSLHRWHRLSSLSEGTRNIGHSLERLCHRHRLTPMMLGPEVRPTVEKRRWGGRFGPPARVIA